MASFTTQSALVPFFRPCSLTFLLRFDGFCLPWSQPFPCPKWQCIHLVCETRTSWFISLPTKLLPSGARISSHSIHLHLNLVHAVDHLCHPCHLFSFHSNFMYADSLSFAHYFDFFVSTIHFHFSICLFACLKNHFPELSFPSPRSLLTCLSLLWCGGVAVDDSFHVVLPVTTNVINFVTLLTIIDIVLSDTQDVLLLSLHFTAFYAHCSPNFLQIFWFLFHIPLLSLHRLSFFLFSWCWY